MTTLIEKVSSDIGKKSLLDFLSRMTGDAFLTRKTEVREMLDSSHEFLRDKIPGHPRPFSFLNFVLAEDWESQRVSTFAFEYVEEVKFRA